MLTADETRLLAYATAIRHDEDGTDLWFAVDELELLPEAHRLTERGWLTRRIHRTDDGTADLVYRLSDAALSAQALSALSADPSAN